MNFILCIVYRNYENLEFISLTLLKRRVTEQYSIKVCVSVLV